MRIILTALAVLLLSESSSSAFHLSSPIASSPPTRTTFCRRHYHGSGNTWIVSKLSAVSDNDSTADIRADDVEAIQQLFRETSDSSGLMSKKTLEQIPTFKFLIEDGDLLQSELDNIWNDAPKFPDGTDRIDVDSFTKIFRDVDDIFESDEVNDEEEYSPTDIAESANVKPSEAEAEKTVAKDEAELEGVFKKLCDSESGLLSFEELKRWEEIQGLFEDNLLGENEFEELWKQTTKSPGTSDSIDVEGFLSFNVALDDLFDFDKEAEEEQEDKIIEVEKTEEALPMVVEENLSPGVLFSMLANPSNYLVGMDDLKRWGELIEMLAEGDLLPEELQAIFNNSAQGKDLDEERFSEFHTAIFDLFEDDDGTDVDTDVSSLMKSLINLIQTIDEDSEIPCGLDADGSEQAKILDIVNQIEQSPINRAARGEISAQDLAGSWQMLYTSSSMMKFNKGLTGLGGSFPGGKFGGLKQTLKANNTMMDVEYKERIVVSDNDERSFDAAVIGDWTLRNNISLLTGEPSIAISVEPAKVVYGPTNTRADHWKSVRSMNLLDLTYLDDEIRIMRGNTSTDTIFVFKREQ